MDTVEMLMTPNPLKLAHDARVGDAARMMVRLDIRHLPIVDADGALMGMVTDFDVFKLGGLVEKEKMWVTYRSGDAARHVDSVCQNVDVVVKVEDPLIQAIQQTLVTRQDAAIVVDEKQHPIGIFTEHDAVRLSQGWLPLAPVSEYIINGPFYTVEGSEHAKGALDLMLENFVRHVIVVRNRVVIGVLSYRDLVEDNIPRGQDLSAEDVMRSHQPYTVTASTPMKTAAATMVRRKVGCLPVVDHDQRLIGVLTRSDIIAAALENLIREGERF